MARIAGVNIPREKRVEIGLTYIYGIGRSTSNSVLAALAASLAAFAPVVVHDADERYALASAAAHAPVARVRDW